MRPGTPASLSRRARRLVGRRVTGIYQRPPLERRIEALRDPLLQRHQYVLCHRAGDLVFDKQPSRCVDAEKIIAVWQSAVIDNPRIPRNHLEQAGVAKVPFDVPALAELATWACLEPDHRQIMEAAAMV